MASSGDHRLRFGYPGFTRRPPHADRQAALHLKTGAPRTASLPCVPLLELPGSFPGWVLPRERTSPRGGHQTHSCPLPGWHHPGWLPVRRSGVAGRPTLSRRPKAQSGVRPGRRPGYPRLGEWRRRGIAERSSGAARPFRPRRSFGIARIHSKDEARGRAAPSTKPGGNDPFGPRGPRALAECPNPRTELDFECGPGSPPAERPPIPSSFQTTQSPGLAAPAKLPVVCAAPADGLAQLQPEARGFQLLGVRRQPFAARILRLALGRGAALANRPPEAKTSI